MYVVSQQLRSPYQMGVSGLGKINCPATHDDTIEWRRRDGKPGVRYGDVSPGPEWDDYRIVCRPRGRVGGFLSRVFRPNSYTQVTAMSPFRGLGAGIFPGMDLTAGQQAGASVGAALGMGGAALYGAAIAGFSAGSWKTAGTGALLAGGVSGITYGAVLGLGGAWVPALLVGGAGATALYFGGRRSYRAMKRGR